MTYPKSGIQDPTPGTQLIGETRDSSPGTLKVEPETRDPDVYFTWDLRPETQDTKRAKIQMNLRFKWT